MKKNIHISLLLFTLSIFSQSLIAASKYWVGNGGNWSDASHWSLTSGGVPGAGAPTSTDLAIFDQNSFSISNQSVIISQNLEIGGMDWKKVSNYPSLQSSEQVNIRTFGAIVLGNNMKSNFKGKIIFVFGDDWIIPNSFKPEDVGSVDYAYEPENLIVKKISKSNQTNTLTVFTINVATTNETCFGNCDGTASVTVTGGVGPFGYSYIPAGPYTGEPGPNLTNMCGKAGNYTVLVRDSSDMSVRSKTFQIIPADEIFATTLTKDNASCFQSCDGQLNMFTGGGTGTLHYTWSNGATTESISSLCAGIYSLSIIDDAGCTFNYRDTITEPTLLVGSISSQTNLACNGVCNGAATASVTGGTAGYTYSWYDAGGSITNSINNQCAGTYHVKITDANGCLDTVPVTITEPILLTVGASTTQNILCANVCIGATLATGSGGTAPLTYSWYDAPGTPSTAAVGSLCAGTYHVEVTDGNGCKDTASTSVTTPGALSTSIVDSTNVLCRGLCTGDATVRATGGTAPYTYNWYNLVAMTDTLATGICAGASNVQVTDANGCRDTATVTITEPASTLLGNIVDQTNNICSYNCNGNATVRVSGGILPYTYNWYDAPGLETDTVASNLCTQDYNVEVTDGNGCTDTVTVSILSPAELIGQIIDSIPLSCLGTCIGSLTVDGSGGTAPYTFDWLSAGNQTTNAISNLCPGTYDVEVTDANNCLDTISYALIPPPGVIASISSQTNNVCFGNCNGSATASGSGGTLPFTYKWYDLAGQTTATVSALCSDTFHVEVTDGTGCKDTTSVVITSPPALVAGTSSITDVTCLGICNGGATASATGGTAPYTPVWVTLNSLVAPSISNRCAGLYMLTVIDANGCQDADSVIISAPQVVVGTMTDSTGTTCFSACDGAANVHASGGTTPYTFDWITAGNQNDSSAINLCGGTHTVQITDANGCIDLASVFIQRPAQLIATIADSTNISCNGLTDGTATVAASGGTPPYTYLWTDVPGNPTTTNVSGLAAGLYHVQVTDSNNCVTTVSVNIQEPAVLNASVTATPTSCNGTCSGALNASATTGGTAPYSYVWFSAGNQTTANIGGLCVGNDSVEVTDAHGCIDTAFATVTEPTLLVATMIDSNQATCPGVCDGDATVSASGGIAPYTYNWYTAGNQGTTLATGLCFGINEVEVTDDNGCKDTVTVSIGAPVVVVATMIDSTVTACSNVCMGDATVSASGGTAPYTYNWFTGGNQNTTFADSLCAGTQSVIVTDANGCMDTAHVTIGISLNVLVATITDSSSTACSNVCMGDATVSAGGGTAPYTYNWFTGGNQNTTFADSLCAGAQSVVISDANGCVDTASVLITISGNTPDVFVLDSTSTFCVGSCDGTATATTIGGTAPYSYNWFTAGNQSDTLAINLCAGINKVEVTDAMGCIDTAQVFINTPIPVSATFVTSNPLCNGDCSGTASVLPGGGSGGYSHSWSNGATLSSVINLCAGTYTDTITDSNGCRDTLQVIITDPVVVQANPTAQRVSCFGDTDGSVVSNPSGGSAPYTFQWDDPSNSTTNSVTGLPAGIYTVIVADSLGCLDTSSVSVISPAVLSLSITDTVYTVCICNGSATVGVSGGTAPYSYLWDDIASQTTAQASNLCVGTYTVTVQDSSLCTDDISIAILDTSSSFVASVVDSTAASCFSSCDGSLTVRGVNGTAPYAFLWNDPSNQTDSTAIGLCVGNYIAQVTDNNNCVRTVHASIVGPTAVSGTASVTEPLCNGDCNGIVAVVPSGGDGGPYTHKWSTLATTDSLYNVCAGVYYDTITDGAGCQGIITVIVGQPSFLNLNLNKQNISCYGANDGSVNASVSGGTAPYSLQWDDVSNSTTASLSALTPGTYRVTVTDSHGCTFTDSATFIEPALLTSVISDSANVYCSCLGSANLHVEGGTLPYSFQWNDLNAQTDSTALNLCAGIYTGTVTDFNGCTTSSMVHIVDTSGFAASITDTNHLVCYGVCIGSATIGATGGTLPYTYSWNDPSNQTDSTAINLCAGNYIGVVTDNKGCQYVLPISINQPDSININVTLTNVSCMGFCDGEIIALASGGTGSTYTYVWNDPLAQNTATADSLCPGSYTLIVTDSVGCTNSRTRTITEPTQLHAFVSSFQDVQCKGLCNGSINALGVGGTAPYTYLWSNAATTPIASALCADTFQVNVTDANGCKDSISQIITEPLLALSSFITDSTILLCNNVCDGIANVRAAGGSGIYTYNWYSAGNQSDTTAINMCAGLNYVEVTDSKGCKDTSQVNMVSPPAIVISVLSQTNVSCNSNCDGAVSISVSGGVAPYAIQWNDPANTVDSTSLDSLCAGTYKVVITDANGCVDSLQITITQPNVLSATVSNITNIVCPNTCIGTATVHPVGGTAPFTFLWPNAGNQTDSNAVNLCDQTYTYIITDTNNCSYTDSVTITNIGLQANVSTVSPVCFGQCTASATVTFTGGLPPFTHSWNIGGNTNSISNVCAGTYHDTITDGTGCNSVVDVVITQPNRLLALVNATNVSCHGFCDGSAISTPTGGTPPYTNIWLNHNNMVTNGINNLCGEVLLTHVIDSKGCQHDSSVTIIDPDLISVALGSKNDASCFGQCDGNIKVLGSGGTLPLKYTWNGGQTTDSIGGLCAANYSVTVTDTNGCPSAQLNNITIAQPTQILISFTDTVHLLCSYIQNGEVRAVVTGGSSPYTYQWNDPALQTTDLATGLAAGPYQVLVTDLKGCKDSSTFTIDSASALSIGITSKNPKCFGDCNGEATAVPLGGIKPYTSILWGGPGNANNATTMKVTGLCQGNYFVTVIDASGCQSSFSRTLNNPPVLSVSISDSNNLSCFGICDGNATVTPVGGTAPYTYTWNDPLAQTTAQATNLCAGKFVVTVVDTNGCTKLDSVYLTEPTKLVSSNTTTAAECTNTYDGAIAETASGGSGKLNFSWSGPAGYSSTVEDPTNILPGRYILTLTDSMNCTLIDTADVAALTFINAYAGNDTAICSGFPITLYGKGGKNYLWNTGQTDSTITFTPNVTAPYILYVSNGNCKDTATVVVTVNTQPDASITMDKYIVLENSSTTLHGSGAGIGGTYDWTPPTSLDDPTVQNPVATPSKTTTYLLTVTTAAGCTDTASATLKTAKDISFPNGITPNGDGRNEKWVIDLIEQFPQCNVEIYNRWGQLLFQSPGYVTQWDGTFDGKPLPVGTYYYIIDLGPGLKKYTGPITLMR